MTWYNGIATFLIGAGLLAISGWGLHRLCIALEDRGYIYYRTKPQSGSNSAMLEIDRLVRPAVEHVISVRDIAARRAEDDTDAGGNAKR